MTLAGIAQAGGVALSTLTSWAMNPLSAIGDVSKARWTYKEYLGLWNEVEDTKIYLKKVKAQLEELMKSNINLCSLGATIEALNLFQDFFFENYLEDTTMNRTFWTTGPSWYRSELTNARQLLKMAVDELNLELGVYGLVTAQLLTSGDKRVSDAMKKLATEIEASSQECAKAAKEYRKLKKRSDWDLCPACSDSSSEAKSTAQQQKSWLSSGPVPPLGSKEFNKVHRARKALEPLDILGMFKTKLEEAEP